MTKQEILAHVDHTLLKADADWESIRRLCDEAAENHTASICINPGWVRQAVQYLDGRVPVCTVIGFPLGATSTQMCIRDRSVQWVGTEKFMAASFLPFEYITFAENMVQCLQHSF